MCIVAGVWMMVGSTKLSSDLAFLQQEVFGCCSSTLAMSEWQLTVDREPSEESVSFILL